MEELNHLLFGSCSFTAAGWEKTFYPPGLKKTAYLGYYAEQFHTVEVDSTFYRIPSEKTVRGWYETTPEDFVFACKARSRLRTRPAWWSATANSTRSSTPCRSCSISWGQ